MRFIHLAFIFLGLANHGVAQLWVQDFETNGLNTAYTSASVFTDNLNSHYNRTNGSNISAIVSPYTNAHGNFLWAGENINATGGGGDGLPNKTITFFPFNVSGQTNLQFRGLFGSGNTGAGWDFDDIVYVEYKMDAGPWIKIMQFAADAPISNAGLYQDSDLNGLGEGVALQPAMQQFTANIPATGTTLQLRIYASCTAQSEEFAFDYLRVYTTTTSLPGCIDPSASNFIPTATTSNNTCQYSGCTNPLAINYNAAATSDNGLCVLSIPNIHINEIHFNPNEFLGFTDLTHEFIELHNATSAAVSIAGWRISGGVDCIFPIGASIPANGFVIVGSTAATYVGVASGVYSYSDDLNNLTENIRLYTATNILVDQVSYFSNCWPTNADGVGPSLELINYSFDNNVASNYCAGTTANGTPGAVNSCYSTQILGCTNPNAINYNANATTNDGSCLIEGCTYPSATNYNASANTDDGSCLYPAPLPGCTNETALNYNPNATVDNGSCTYANPIGGCTYPAAVNYNPAAESDDGSCVYAQVIGGCTYNNALNYNPNATTDDGTCQYPLTVPGCTNNLASNFNSLATIDNGSCLYNDPTGGCTYPGALNFDAQALLDDGSCVFGSGIAGCTYSNATNYASASTIDDGSCEFSLAIPGCTNASAINFNILATLDDGTCIYPQFILGCTYTEAINFNPIATQDAGNCQFATSVPGCTNPAASNFNNAATIDNATCIYAQPLLGCTYSQAVNFNPLAQTDDGTCVFSSSPTLGCTYANALNYDLTATEDNGSCIFIAVISGCTTSSAINYNLNATFDDGSCQYTATINGCTYSNATNFSIDATLDDGSCNFVLAPSTCPEDIDGDLIVGVSDLLLFIAAFGTTCN